MADRRNQNNLTLAQRRGAVAARRAKRPAGRGLSALNQAKDVLRRTGMVVHGAQVDEAGAGGWVRVDGRKRSPEWVIDRAAAILEAEAERNAQLRREHGLP